MLTRTLELARKRGLIDSNPSKDAVRPKSTRRKPFAPLEDDVRSLLKSVAKRDPEIADLATMLASTGMRTGEVLGLRWADVDLAAAEAHVAAAITDGGPGVGVVESPPSDPTGETCHSRLLRWVRCNISSRDVTPHFIEHHHVPASSLD